jgi:Flp pilus assembly protein TadG
MKVQIDLHGQTIALKRKLIRAAKSTESHIQPESRGLRLQTLLRIGEQGSALVEFTLLLPALLLITTGIMVFGVAMNNYLQLTNAVSIGARTLAISSQITLDPCATASTAITNAAPNLTPSKFTFAYTLNGTTYTGTSCNSSSLTTGAAGNLASGTTAKVTATYPFNLSVFGKVYSQNNAVFSATSTELVQ